MSAVASRHRRRSLFNDQISFERWPPQDIQAIAAPALVIVADSDVIRPEHAVEIFRLLGGGVPGDLGGLPRSRLAVLPGTTQSRWSTAPTG